MLTAFCASGGGGLYATGLADSDGWQRLPWPFNNGGLELAQRTLRGDSACCTTAWWGRLLGVCWGRLRGDAMARRRRLICTHDWRRPALPAELVSFTCLCAGFPLSSQRPPSYGTTLQAWCGREQTSIDWVRAPATLARPRQQPGRVLLFREARGGRPHEKQFLRAASLERPHLLQNQRRQHTATRGKLDGDGFTAATASCACLPSARDPKHQQVVSAFPSSACPLLQVRRSGSAPF